MKPAPIILFAYNRLFYTKNAVEALRKNKIAPESSLFIYSDGGKGKEDWALTHLCADRKPVK